MAEVSLHQFLVIYTWFPLAGLLLLMLLIARFYQKFSDAPMFFWFYSVPIVAFGFSAVRYASVRQLMRDPLADVLLGIGGISLIVLSARLYHHMGRTRLATSHQDEAP